MGNIFKYIMLFLLSFSSVCDADIRVMTLNTEWLWTPFDGNADGRLKHIKDMDKKDYREELTFYVKQIESRAIDIVALSEIENKQVSDELIHELNLTASKKWNAFFKQGRDTATGQDVAIISRLPYVEGSLTDFGFPAGFIPGEGKAKKLSKIVGAQFWASTDHSSIHSNQKIGVITAHLLSKRRENKKKANNRKKQALGVKQAINTFRKTSDALIVMGDFNDYLASSTLEIIRGQNLHDYRECENFSKAEYAKQAKRWKRNIDHLLYADLHCRGQYKVDLQTFSDHPAIYGEFKFLQSR